MMMAECAQLKDKCDVHGGDGKANGKRSTTSFNIHRKIFVGNISYRIRTPKLSQFFSKFGPVEHCYLVKDHLKKWSKGIAFITYKNEESMRKALAACDEQLLLDNRQMRVKAAELSVRATYWKNPEHHTDDSEEARGDTDQVCTATSPLQASGSTTVRVHAKTTMDCLFDEILIQIFSLLNMKERIGVERVCWRWKQVMDRCWVSQTHVHFRNIFKRFGGLSDRMLNTVLLRCGSYVRSLDLSASPRCLSDFSMDIIGKYCPDLLELNLAAVKVTDHSLSNLAAKCSKLQSVSLKGCLHISDKGIDNLLRGCTALQCLDLTNLTYLSGKCFNSIGDQVRKLVLIDCHKLQDSHMEVMVSRCPALEELYISSNHQLTSTSIRSICQKCTKLRVFHAIALNTAVGTEVLQDIGNLKNLEELNLSMNCMLVNDGCLQAITRGCEKLKSLNLSRCISVTDAGILSLHRLQELQVLDISYLNDVTEESVLYVICDGKLRKLVAKTCKCISDQLILSLTHMCPDIEHLDVSGCFCVTNRIFDGFRVTGDLNIGKTIELYLGGTSVDWVADDVHWINNLANLKVYMHNFVLDDLQADREMILFASNYDEEGEDQVAAPSNPADNYDGPVEYSDDWDDGEEFNDYLDNDDVLAAERWEMS